MSFFFLRGFMSRGFCSASVDSLLLQQGKGSSLPEVIIERARAPLGESTIRQGGRADGGGDMSGLIFSRENWSIFDVLNRRWGKKKSSVGMHAYTIIPNVAYTKYFSTFLPAQ